MRRIKLTAVAALLCASAIPTWAADLGRPVYKAPVMVAPEYFSWNGFYIGANVGYGMGDTDVSTTGQLPANIANVAGGARPARTSLSGDGVTAGLQMGYNWQAGRWVYGLETDINYMDSHDTLTVVTTGLPPGNAPGLENTFRHKLTYMGTVRGRIGYTFDRTLVYATGGLAYGGVNSAADFTGPNGAPVQFAGNRHDLRVGYAVGGGVEHAFAPRWSMKLEYLYYNLGSETVNVAVIPGSGGGGSGYNSSFDVSGHIVRAGLNYRF